MINLISDDELGLLPYLLYYELAELYADRFWFWITLLNNAICDEMVLLFVVV